MISEPRDPKNLETVENFFSSRTELFDLIC